MGKFKFEFYGWLIPLSIIINIMVNVIAPIPFLGMIFAWFAYAKWKDKKLDWNFVANVILTDVVWFLIILAIIITGAIGIGALTSFRPG